MTGICTEAAEAEVRRAVRRFKAWQSVFFFSAGFLNRGLRQPTETLFEVYHAMLSELIW